MTPAPPDVSQVVEQAADRLRLDAGRAALAFPIAGGGSRPLSVYAHDEAGARAPLVLVREPASAGVSLGASGYRGGRLDVVVEVPADPSASYNPFRYAAALFRWVHRVLDGWTPDGLVFGLPAGPVVLVHPVGALVHDADHGVRYAVATYVAPLAPTPDV